LIFMEKLVPQTGFEPATPSLRKVGSGHFFFWAGLSAVI